MEHEQQRNEPIVGWCLIPAFILSRTDLSLSEKVLYGRILGLADKGGYCFASNAWLGEQIGLAQGTVANMISRMAKKGLLRVEVLRNEKNEVTERRIYPLLGGYSSLEWGGIHTTVNTYSRHNEESNREEYRNILFSNENNMFGRKPTGDEEGGQKKQRGDPLVNYLLSAYRKRFGHDPTDKKPRFVANTFLQSLRKFQKEIAPHREYAMEELIDKVLDWYCSSYELRGDTLDVVRRKAKIVLEKTKQKYEQTKGGIP